MKKEKMKKIDEAFAKPMTVLVHGKPVKARNFDDALRIASKKIWADHPNNPRNKKV
jgi:hypothetical protein